LPHHASLTFTRKNWEEFGEWLVDKIYDEIHDFCWNISGAPVGDCFSSHALDDMYDLAEMYIENDVYEVVEGVYVNKEGVLELVKEMPDDIYDKYNDKLQKMLEEAAEQYSLPEDDELDLDD